MVGSPGTTRTSRNTSVSTAHRVGTARSSRLATKRSTLPPCAEGPARDHPTHHRASFEEYAWRHAPQDEDHGGHFFVVASVSVGPRWMASVSLYPKSTFALWAQTCSCSKSGTAQTSSTILRWAVAHSSFCLARSGSVRAASISLSATSQCEKFVTAVGVPTIDFEWKNCVRYTSATGKRAAV